MKLQFDSSLDYQLDAINAVVDVFAGQIKSDSSFIVGHRRSWVLRGSS